MKRVEEDAAKVLEWLRRQPPLLLTLCGILSVVFVGLGEYYSGPAVSFALLYLVPIALATVLVGLRSGIFASGVCSLVWMSADIQSLGAEVSAVLHCWNFVMRFGLFLFFVILLHRQIETSRILHITLQVRTSELTDRTRIMQSVLNNVAEGVVIATEGGALIFNPSLKRLLCMQNPPDTIEEWVDKQRFLQPDGITSVSPDEFPLFKAVQGEPVDATELLITRPDSSDGIWLSATARPLRDEDGTLHGGVMVFTDITDRKRIELQVLDATERERQRIGQDLHDGICSELVGIAFKSEVVEENLRSKSLSEADSVKRITELINKAIALARYLSRELHPANLKVNGLTAALGDLATNTEHLTGVSCPFRHEPAADVEDLTTATHLYRIAQEALQNAIKHGRARNVILSLGVRDGCLELVVRDDGIGIPESLPAARGIGIELMKHRARIIGAEFEMRRNAEDGTVVTCSLPARAVST